MPETITPSLWFDTEAEDAARFYTSVFKDSRIVKLARFGEGAPRPAGMVMGVEFELEGQPLQRDQRRSRVQLRRGGLLPHQLRGPGRRRPLLGAADRRRRGGPVRLAQGPLRPLLAGRAGRPRAGARRPRPRP